MVVVRALIRNVQIQANTRHIRAGLPILGMEVLAGFPMAGISGALL